MNIIQIEYIEMYVSDLTLSTEYFKKYGFKIKGYKKAGNDINTVFSYLMECNNIKLILTTSLEKKSLIDNFIHRHGDSIRDVAFKVNNLEEIAGIMGHGLVNEITPFNNHKKLLVPCFGDVVHTFFEYDYYLDLGFTPIEVNEVSAQPEIGIFENIDHIAIALPIGTIEVWKQFYIEKLGFEEIYRDNINTELTSINQVVVSNTNRKIKMVLVEDHKSKRLSQIERFIQEHQGPGVQHLSFKTLNIIQSIMTLRTQGIQFVGVPDNYYDQLRINNKLHYSFQEAKDCGVLIDCEDEYLLLQVFTKPIHLKRPTFFLELIERHNIDTFTPKNVQALFQSIEKEQTMKGK